MNFDFFENMSTAQMFEKPYRLYQNQCKEFYQSSIASRVILTWDYIGAEDIDLQNYCLVAEPRVC